MFKAPHLYEVHPGKHKRGVDLVFDAMPVGRLWCGDSNGVANAVGCAEHFSRSHGAVIRVYDAGGNVIEMHEHKGTSRNRSDYGLRFIVEYLQLPRRLAATNGNVAATSTKLGVGGEGFTEK